MSESNGHQRVSIIILSYKNLNYIIDTINSVLEQDYPNIELIISDDGSEEFNGKTYRDYIENRNKGNITNLLVHKNEKNVGTVKNINHAIKMSTGSIIKTIAADDAFYDRRTISKVVNFIEANDSFVVASNIATCDEELNLINDIRFHKVFDRKLKPLLSSGDKQKILQQLCMGSFIPAPGVFYLKKIFDKYGYFDEGYRLLEDWPMWLRLVKLGCKIDYFDEISVKYRISVGISTIPNDVYRNDNFKCYTHEVLPNLIHFGYWTKKKVIWYNTRKWEYDKYSALNKVTFIIKNIDLILLYLIPNKLKDIEY